MIIFHLKGSIDTYNSHDFESVIHQKIVDKFHNIIFECSSLEYISSTGVGTFMSFLRKLKKMNGRMILVSLRPQVYKVFQTLGFSNFIEFEEDLSIAKETLRK